MKNLRNQDSTVQVKQLASASQQLIEKIIANRKRLNLHNEHLECSCSDE